MTPWRMGFLGAITNDLSYWIAEHIPDDVGTIGIPFLGSAKAYPLMAKEGRTLESWDTQYVVMCAVEGVFKAAEADLRVDTPRLTKGYLFESLGLKSIDEQSAALIDYIAAHGSMYEKTALTTSMMRCTYLGRFDQWNSNATGLWMQFNKRLEAQKPYLNVPGELIHHHENFYSSPVKEYDLLFIDPPKIVSRTDVYSAGKFDVLNKAVGGPDYIDVPFDRWVKYDYIGKIRSILLNPSKYLIFVYTSDVRPNIGEMKTLLEEYGTLEEEVRVTHRKRYDYGLIYVRNGKTL